MPQLDDLSLGALGADTEKKFDSVVKHLNEQNRRISNEDRTKITKSDSGVETLTYGQLPGGGNGLLIKDGDSVNKALFGEFPDHSIGLKIAQDGTDVTTATDSQLIFNSSQNMFKIVKKATSTIPQFATTYNGTITSGTGILIYPHGLTYTPIIQVYAQGSMFSNATGGAIATSYIQLPVVVSDLAGFNQYYFPNAGNTTSYPLSILCGVDSSNVYVQGSYLDTGSHADTIAAVPVTMFLMQETAT